MLKRLIGDSRGPRDRNDKPLFRDRLTNALRNLLLAGGLLGTVPAAGDHVDGAWTEVHDWPLIAIHAALTPDGRVLTYGTTGSGTQTGYFIYDIWDPTAGLTGGHLTLDNMTLTDIFCSSQIVLPQSGDILIAGGDNWTGNRTTNTGNNNSNLFDYGDNTLARSANMNRARWYSSATALVSGEIYIQGGTGGADFPEVRQLNGNFRLLTSAPTSGYAVLFPRNFLAPDGRVFGYDTSGKMYYVNAVGTGSITSAGQFASSNAGWTSSAAMFAPGKILQMGGNSNGAVVIDINGPQPLVTATQSMSSKRMWVSATVLPDGQVLATAGSEVENQLAGVNNSAEIWNPATGEWHLGSAGEKARLYHNTALLLPDATVLVAGGGAPGPLNNTNAEVYYPPYLFDEDDDLAMRPAILSAPDTANVGDAVSIEVDTTDIARVTLVKTGSVTHSVNMDQRFLELPFTASANMLEATLPERASDTPPGFYQLFVLDEAGVPSHGRMLRINIDLTPNVSVDYTPTIGGGGGASFLLSCNADEILVGVHGRYATYVNQVGPQCVTMDQLGRWIGNPVDRPATGTTPSGTAFSKTCPRDFAVSGFRGRSGQYVNQVEIECRALTPSGDLSGAGQFLGATGGAGGNAQGLLRCGTDNPAYALYGRSGGWLDAFGVQCRQGAITPISINSEPVIVNPGTQSGIVGLPASLQLTASDGDNDPLTFSATGLPAGLALNAGSGLIGGTPTTAGTFNVAVMVSDGADLDTANFNWHIAAVEPLSVQPMPVQDPVIAGTPVSYAATAHGGFNPVYKWNFGDGTLETAWSSSSSVEHVFSDPGIYYVTLTVNDDFNVPQVQTFQQTVHLPLTAGQPTRSSRIVYEDVAVGNDRLWVVNSDNDTVSVFDASDETKLAEIEVGSAPRTLAVGPNGRIWVANGLSHDLSVIDSTSFAVLQTVALPHGSEPYGIAISPVAGEAFVVLAATGQLLKLDASNGATVGTANVGPKPRHLAVNADGSTVYVSRFITGRQPGEETAQVLTQLNGVDTGGEVKVVNPATMTVTGTVVLRHSLKVDAENQGSGVPNYLGALAISPDGTHGWVPSKQDNIGRGTLRNGSNLNFQNTVRAISSRIELPGHTETYASRLDLDNASFASAAAFDPLGIYLFVALETSREVAVIDVHGNAELFRVDVGRAPQGLALSADGLTLYVSNFMDRTVDVFDLTELRTEGQWNIPKVETLQSVASETLAPEILAGKQLFYDARDPRLALDRYMSCASCHNDGGGDGRVWDLTGMGEGLRNTISLMGAGPEGGPLHWSQNFDEVQDFEGQIRTLAGGTGLMTNGEFNAGTRREPLGDPKAGVSDDLDALAVYVNSLRDETSSPQRLSDGSLTVFATEGREVFRRENCAACHSGVAFSDSDTNAMHDIGTIKPSSGLRLGQPLSGIDTPTLRGVRKSAPYLHDGSAASLEDAVTAHQTVSLDAEDLSALVAYLEQIDVNEQSAPLPNVPPDVTNPGPQTDEVESGVALNVEASDQEGDTLSFAAAGLPPGLSIDSGSGDIGGVPTSVGEYDVTVTVDDGRDATSVEFAWQITEKPNEPPQVGNPGPQAHEVESDVMLAILASDPDEDVLSYSASDLPAGLSISVISGIISGSPVSVGHHDVTVTVDDGTDATNVQFAWEIAEKPNEPPQVDNPGPQAHEVESSVSLAIVASDPDEDVLSYSANGLPPGLSISVISGLISGTPAAVGTHDVTVTVDDGTDTTSTHFDWEITEKPNEAPDVANPGPQTHEVESDVTLVIVASDPDGDTLSYSATGLPTGLAVNSSNGVIGGSPVSVGSYDVTVAVGDGTDATSVQFTWQITEKPNEAPVVENPGPQTHEVESDVTLAVVASDPDGDDLSYSATGLPSGLAINASSGVVIGVPSGTGSYDVTVTVGDGTDTTSVQFGWEITEKPNEAPVVDNPGPQSHEVESNVSLAIVASDPDEDVLSYSANGLPPGLSISVISGLISGTPAAVGNHDVTVTVDDGTDTTSTHFDWEITEKPNEAPDVANPGPQTHEIESDVTSVIVASDPDDDVLSYSATGLPPGLVITASSGLISGVPTTIGSYNVTATVGDGTDTTSVQFSWQITEKPNQAPVVANPGPQTHEVESNVTLAIVASDPDGDTLSYSATGLPSGLAINASSGMVSGAPGGTGSYDVTVTVGDGTDTTSVQFSWEITDKPNEPPVVDDPGPQGHEVESDVMLPVVASDPDGDVLSYSATALPPGLSVDGASGVITGRPTTIGDYVVTVTVDDGVDATSVEFSWEIAEKPNEAPEVVNPGPQTDEVESGVTVGIVASDPDGDVLSYSASGLPPGLSISVISGVVTGTPISAGHYSANVNVDDGTDITSIGFTWEITRKPNEAPVLANPGNQFSEQGADVMFGITASDPDGDVLTYSASGLPQGMSIDAASGVISGIPTTAGLSTVTVTVGDGTVTVSVQFAWTISPPPVVPVNASPIVENPGDQSSEAGSSVVIAIVATDPDGDVLAYSASGLPAGLSIESASGVISGTPTSEGRYIVRVTVNDGADASSVEFIWEISEVEAPPEAPNRAPAVANPGDQSSEQNESASLGVVASDPDGDTLAYSASGLPSGLSIDSASGVIGGTPTTVGIYAVVVSVQDGTDSTSIEFEWEVTAAVEEPSEENPPGAESPEREETSGGGGIGVPGIAVLALFAALRRAAVRIALLLPVVALSATTLAATTTLPQLDRVRILQSPVVIPDATLTDQHGELVSLDELRGKVALVFFGFTNCPDVCPMAMQSLRQLERTSEFDRDEVAYVLISVDGDRDTPEAMKAFLARYSPSFIGLTGEPAAVRLIASEFRASFFKGSPTGQGSGYDVSHSPQVFVVDAEGRLRAEFYNASNEAMKAVVSALIDEAGAR